MRSSPSARAAPGGLVLTAVFLAALALAPRDARAAGDADLPDFDGYVVDTAGVIDDQSRKQIIAVASKLDHAGVAQLAVCTVVSLGDRDLRQFASDLFTKWKLGHDKKRSDGALLVLVPGGPGHRKIRLEVGYGLEGVLPDGKVGALIDREAVPALKRDQYGPAALGMITAVAGILSSDAAAGGDTAPGKDSPRGGKGYGGKGGRARVEANPLGLGLAVLAFGALLVSLMVAATRKQLPGQGHGIGLAGATAVGLAGATVLGGGVAAVVALVIGLAVNAIAFFSIRAHKCPQCGQWMSIDEQVLDAPTYWSSGEAEVRQRCSSCRYRNSYRKTLPRLQRAVVIGGWGGGGGGGGGGDDSGGFSGGGGGESGGGGADREV